MLLSYFRREHLPELRADFRQYYGVGLHEVSVLEAADLAACLPSDSRCIRAEVPEAEWTVTQYLLSNIEYWLHWLVWAKTEDGQKNRHRPVPLAPHQEKEENPSAMTVEELADFLSRPRREFE